MSDVQSQAVSSPYDSDRAEGSPDMNNTPPLGIKHVIGPDGRRLTLADLPSSDTKRWVMRRKAEVVAAVRGGLLSLEEACSRYALNYDEFLSWQYCIDRYGLAGLRTTRTQYYITSVARLKNSRLRKARWN